MKQAILNLKKKLLIVERDSESVFLLDLKEVSKNIRLGKMFKLTDVTESEFTEWVDVNNNFSFAGDGIYKYKNYRLTGETYASYNLVTAKESFFSYLKSQGVYFENPLDWEKKAYLFKGSENSWGHDDLKRWQEAESKVWNLSRCYLFQII